MNFTNDFAIDKLFLTKDIKIIVNNQSIFKVHAPTVSDFYLNDTINGVYHLLMKSTKELQTIYVVPITSPLDALQKLLFQLGGYDRYRLIYDNLIETLPFFIPDINIDTKNKTLSVNGLTVTEEIWEYILYVLKLSCGEKVNAPLTFDSEEARKFYMAQREQEEKIAALRRKQNPDKDGLMKVMLSITYAFPSITIDYLLNQTMAQIQWLQKYAAGAMSYEVNAQAMAAGNMKKGQKLDFFIK